MNMQININAFEERFNKEYDFLYDNGDAVAGYNEAVEAFDEFASANPNFIREFIKFRGDYISSDREAAAFMFAMESFGII